MLHTKRLNKTQTTSLLKQINRLAEISPFQVDTTKVFSTELPFYQQTQLLDLVDVGGMPVKNLSVCSTPNGFHLMEFSANPLLTLNKFAKLLLSVDTVCAYIAVYTRFLRLPEGQLRLVDSIEDLLMREDLPPNQRKVLAQTIKPASVVTTSWPMRVEATVQFQTSLFKCAFSIDKDGAVQIIDRALLFADLPLVDEALRA